MTHYFQRLARTFLITAVIFYAEHRPANAEPPEVNPKNQTEETPPKPRRRLRPSIGIGGNVGVSGSKSGLSEGGFSIMTKTDLSDYWSIRSTNIFGSEHNDNTFAVTANRPIQNAAGNVKIVPFIGGGVVLSSKSFFQDVTVRGLATGGVDLPISDKFTATTSVNVGFTEDTSVGIQLGVLYRF
jgi:hypothetical protein